MAKFSAVPTQETRKLGMLIFHKGDGDKPEESWGTFSETRYQDSSTVEGIAAVNAGNTSLVSLLQAQLSLAQVGTFQNIPLSFSH